MRINEIIQALIAFHPPIDETHTADTVKWGNAEQECTGIVVTCFASANVIRAAADLGANLILAHEPLFWTHEDDTGWLTGSTVFSEKTGLLEDSGIVVWRDHDHIHGGDPGRDLKYMDYIFYGIMKELNWEQYKLDYPNKPLLFQIPETDAETLGRELISKLGLNGLRIMGDRHAKVSRVFLCEHIRDHDLEEKYKILKTEREEIDALIPLEVIDWTLAAFVRDCSQLGHPKVMYNVGHFNLEELGMKYMTQWLPELVGDVPVRYIPSGDSFDFII